MATTAEIAKVVLEFVAVTLLTIIAERYLSDMWAFPVLALCVVGLCWLHRTWLYDFGQEHRIMAVCGCTLALGACGVVVGLRLTKPAVTNLRAPEVRPPKLITEDQKARARFADQPDALTLHDMFLIDSTAAQQSSIGAMFVDDPKTINVEYGINTDLNQRSKFLSFYIPPQEATEGICRYLAKQYKFVLENAPQLLVEQKGPGDSGTTSTNEAVFSKRIYIYHQTFLPAETTVKLTNVYKGQGLSAIFRSTDYLATKKMEATIQKQRRERAAP